MITKVINRLGRFLLVFMPLLVIAQIISFTLLKKQEVRIEHKIEEISGKLLLFAGASHIAFGISDKFPGVTNVAARSEPYIFTLKKLQLLKPKIAIVGLNALNIQQNSNNAFDDGLLNLPQYRYLFSYLTAEEKEDIFALTDFETEAFFYAKRWMPFLGNRLKEEQTPLIFGGWENWQTLSVTDQFLLKKRFYNEFERYGFQVSAFQMKYLHKILSYAKQHKMQVVFLATPLHPEFLKLIPRQTFEEFNHLIGQLQSQYDFIFYDYINFPLPGDHFYDADHLNGLGANIFTKTVLERLEKEAVIKN